MQPRPTKPLGCALEAFFQHVAGNQPALVLHARGNRQGLAAGPGAEIHDLMARFRIGQQTYELRALILNFILPGFERVGRSQRRPAIDSDAQRRPAGGFPFDARGCERRDGAFPVSLDPVDPEIERAGSSRAYSSGMKRSPRNARRCPAAHPAFDLDLLRHVGMVER